MVLHEFAWDLIQHVFMRVNISFLLEKDVEHNGINKAQQFMYRNQIKDVNSSIIQKISVLQGQFCDLIKYLKYDLMRNITEANWFELS